VSGIDATLISDHNIRRAAQQICNLTFPFIAPLSTNYNYVSQGFISNATVSQTTIILID
jgi:hypothetical protein